ncbi:uracil-DNA glycosylase family protein [Parasphingopyxis marina]|uniref:Uracil-DNA glycosylase n=1 Tax=Parasphingopyxis marina TaxID=2761622 RepID=A0A842HUI1_9SPHN|nr:uracil-DNA glycosylase family protein [Parasphingopyxis marina]MBC2777638.1 uracil-DNA glycosylase [Parasphingopyxis marina]
MAVGGEMESALDWWREAGADVIVGDEPRGWLTESKPLAPKAPTKGAPVAVDTPPVPVAMPSALAEFRPWLLDATIIEAPREARLDAAGDPASGLMVLIDMPEQGDESAGKLLSGEAGLLFDRMLAAIGRDRASIYLAAFSPARVLGGALNETAFAALADAAKRHVALAAPRQLLLMGEAPSRAFCGVSLNEARGKQRVLNHDGGTVSAIATFHPRFLLQQPRLKAQSWKDLQMLVEGMNA